KVAEVAPPRLPELPVNEYPLAIALIVRLPKVATPPLTVTVVVPLNVPPPGLAPSFTVTWSVLSDVTRLLYASSTLTVGAGVRTVPTAALDGCCPKTTWVAADGLTATVALPVIEPEFASVAANV